MQPLLPARVSARALRLYDETCCRAGYSTKFTVISRRDHRDLRDCPGGRAGFLPGVRARRSRRDDGGLGRGRRYRLRPSRRRASHRGRRGARILAADLRSRAAGLRFRLTGSRVFSGRMLSIHSVYEHVSVAGDPRPANPVLATNIYLLTDRGWRMLMHHASPLAGEAAPAGKRRPPCCTDESLPRAMVAARRASADHLPLFRSEAPPAALSARTLGHAGRRLHRSGLGRRSATRRRWWRLFHGLEGCSTSHYATALMRAVATRGWRGVVVHFRGCSGEPNRLPRAYHSGDADEIDWILRRLRALPEHTALLTVGVSLGGNALLKWLGRERATARGYRGCGRRRFGTHGPDDRWRSPGQRLDRALYGSHFLAR